MHKFFALLLAISLNDHLLFAQANESNTPVTEEFPEQPSALDYYPVYIGVNQRNSDSPLPLPSLIRRGDDTIISFLVDSVLARQLFFPTLENANPDTNRQVVSNKIDNPITGQAWYRNGWTYAVLGLISTAWLFFAGRKQRMMLVEQQKQLTRSEEKIVQLQSAQLDQEKLVQKAELLEEVVQNIKKQLRTKTIELAKKAKADEEKSRLLQSVKKKLQQVEEESPNRNFRVSQMNRLLESFSDQTDRSFGIQIEELQQDFMARLSKNYPKLSPYDLRLATYLKVGLSTKEIANMTQVLASSVNVSRSRLRKKLGLDSKVNLIKFLNQL